MSAQAQTPFPRRAMAQKNANSNYMDTLKRERDRFVALAFCAADVLFELDGEKKVTYAAGATKALTNLEPEEAIGSQFIDLVDRTDRGYVSERLEAMDHVNRLDPLMVRLRGPEGPTPRLMMTGYHLPDLPGSVFIALRLASKDELLTDSNDTRRDSETGLLNRDAFAEVAAQKIRDAEGRGEDLKLTMLRLGDMSDLRTRLDEEADRDLMRTLGACLTGDQRHNEAAARFDDENFGVLNSDGFDLNSLHQRIESHIRNADPQGVGIRVRHQTADASLTGASSQDTIKALLYTITQYCDDPSNEPAIKSLSQNLENLVQEASGKMVEFRALVSEENFDAVYQPIVDVFTSEIHHYEVLARFAGGLDRSPYELITFAENMGLICDFDFAMFRKTIDQLHAWRRKGKVYNLAVNLSGRSISNPSFLEALLKLLGEHDDLRNQLSIEITESARIHDLERTNETIQSLRKAGHTVCLDDFGAGAAALRYLHALDVDIVKIDGAYIRGAHEDRKLNAFLKAITGLCADLDVDTIAEMVEDKETVELLRQCRIPYAQGYLFGKPQPEIDSFTPERKPKVRRGGWSRIAGASA
jgi:EAL domain-containing protein (putative c-di-GMP-specific phosphodiesterase class I)/GGDEF domain-containing protein